LNVFRPGNLLASADICEQEGGRDTVRQWKYMRIDQDHIIGELTLSAKGSLPYGESRAKYSYIGLVA